MYRPEFISSVREILGGEAESLLESLNTESPVSIRINPFKIPPGFTGTPVPWCRNAIYLDNRPRFTLDPLLHAGSYYVQEAGSMFIDYLFRAVAEGSGPLRVLDMCAAPGGKTTLLAAAAPAGSMIVANEIIRNRCAVLTENVIKWGTGNIVVTNNDPRAFTRTAGWFDVVLADAPCSGEGMFRKMPEFRAEWEPGNVDMCCSRQKEILLNAWETLRPGGYLIYSTCTFNRRENEGNARWLTGELGAETVNIPVPPEWNVDESEVEGGIRVFRFWPHRTASEGFFATVVRKPSGGGTGQLPRRGESKIIPADKKTVAETASWLGKDRERFFFHAGNSLYAVDKIHGDDIARLSGILNIVYSGVKCGELFGGRLKPDPALALYYGLDKEKVNYTDLDLPTALDYLRLNNIDPLLFSEGMNLTGFRGQPLGWIKRIGNRCNNGFPKQWRIMNL